MVEAVDAMTIKPWPRRYIVVAGNPADGFDFYGPFGDSDKADEWREDLDDDGWVVELKRP
jgi:hypothetical protein